jgi:hypothetical protein
MKMKFNYTDYGQIDPATAAYILNVADADNIGEIELKDINKFLNEMDIWYGLEESM